MLSADDMILIVEDDADVREAIRETVEFEGYRAVEAANGREALEYLSKNPAPCIVLLDLMMPVMNGFEFLQAVRNDPKLRSVSILVLSAATREKLEETVKTSGAVGFLTKPVQIKPLMEAVSRYC
jgi:CheY-like chemotaxis protein